VDLALPLNRVLILPMRNKILYALSVLGSLCVTAHANAQTTAPSTFVITNGSDTVAVEKFTARPTSLVGDLRVMQGSQPIHVSYELTLRPDGSASRVKTIDDSPNMFSGFIMFDMDAMSAARADPATKGAALRMGPPNGYPTIGTSIALMEQLVRATHPAVGDSAAIRFINIRNGGDGMLTVRRVNADSVVIVCVGCMQRNAREELRFAVGKNGDVTGGYNPALNWVITRDGAIAGAAPCPVAAAPAAAAAAPVTPAVHASGSTPERTLGAPTVIASEPFWNIASVRELSDGRVLVLQRGPMNGFARAMASNMMNIIAPRCGRGSAAVDSLRSRPEPPAARIVLFDSKLKQASLVGHAGTGPNDYQQPEALHATLADTTLVLDAGRGDMLVIDPSGKIVGTRPVPGGNGALAATGGLAVDRSGRLLFSPREQIMKQTAAGMEGGTPDSLAIVAFDPRTGGTMPVAHVRTAGMTTVMQANPSIPGAFTSRMKPTPFAAIDDWVMMPDGTLAIIRGADLHIDWIAPDGKIRSTPPIPYARRAVSDSDKVAFIKAMHATDSMMKKMPSSAMITITQVEPDSFPRFKPPFTTRGAKAASDGTIWLPAKIISPAAADGYYVIGPDGKIRELVHLPAGQRLIGFGKGVIYVAYNESRIARVPLH
jgi:hypothetical protein